MRQRCEIGGNCVEERKKEKKEREEILMSKCMQKVENKVINVAR